MNEVRSILRSARKVDELIQFSLDYTSLMYLRKIKHTGNTKLAVYQADKHNLVLHYDKPLFMFEKIPSYVPYTNKRKIMVGTGTFDVQVYDKSEIFNLSTIHDINLLSWLQVFCSTRQAKIRNIIVSPDIHQDLLYEAYSAMKTQYEKLDTEKYKLYRGTR